MGKEYDNFGSFGCDEVQPVSDEVMAEPIKTGVDAGADFPVAAVSAEPEPESVLIVDPQFIAHSGVPRIIDQPLANSVIRQGPEAGRAPYGAPGSEMNYDLTGE